LASGAQLRKRERVGCCGSANLALEVAYKERMWYKPAKDFPWDSKKNGKVLWK
jgi:hypothetical protein